MNLSIDDYELQTKTLNGGTITIVDGTGTEYEIQRKE